MRVTVSRLVLTMMAISWCVGGSWIVTVPCRRRWVSSINCAHTRWNELGSASTARCRADRRMRCASRRATESLVCGVENISSRARSRSSMATRDGATRDHVFRRRLTVDHRQLTEEVALFDEVNAHFAAVQREIDGLQPALRSGTPGRRRGRRA